MTDLHWKSAAKLVKGYAKKKFSPVEVAKACLAQIERHDKQLNAMVAVHADEALAQAKASEKRWMKAEPQGPVDGVPTLDQGPAAGARLADAAGLAHRRQEPGLGPGRAERGPAARMRRGVPRQHHHAGVRLEGRDGLAPDRHHPQPVGHDEDARRLVGRVVRRGGGGLCAADAGHRWRRLDPHSGGLHRHLRPQAVLRAGSGLSAVALRHGGPCRADDPHGGRRLPDDERHLPARRARLDLAAL